MTPIFVALWFLACIAATYLGMRLICFLKREYAEAENRLMRGILATIRFFEEVCAGCKKGCEEHPVLLRRAIRIGLIIATASTTAWFLARC